jgi:RHS repeat-associated protein
VAYTHDPINRVVSVTDPGSGAQTTTIAYAEAIGGVHDRKTTRYPGGSVHTELVDQTGSSAGQQLGYNTLNQTSSARKSTGTVNRTLSYLGATQYTRTAYGATNVVNSSVLGVVAHGAVAFTRTPDGTLVSRRSGTARAYYLRDGLGSTAALVDAAGTVRNRYAYSPWGQTTTTCPTNACVSNPFAYTGAEHDEATGLYKIGHRYYQPDHGRWTQPDPLGARINTVMPTEAHPYLYAGANPTNYMDPDGTHAIIRVWRSSTPVRLFYSAGVWRTRFAQDTPPVVGGDTSLCQNQLGPGLAVPQVTIVNI